MKKRLGFDLILLGAPASGKDTQAKILMSKYSLRPVESGKHWRAMAKKNNTEGRMLRRTMSLGQPTPVPLMKKFLTSNINKAQKNKDLIFIGNPRLEPEAILLSRLLRNKRRDFLALFIQLSKKEILNRIKPRINLHRRSDDSKLEYVLRRIQWQAPGTSKSVKYFQSIHRLKFINGKHSIKKVANDIQKAVYDYTRSKRN
ncbi:MAG: nucleoside monophosphate kinase [Candidatus Doudnabacteria bacterium]|nr:nucleoside monophosphate kinase [Candidatus Doudnabacteria bacterium]